MTNAELQDYLHVKIPLTRLMRTEVRHVDALSAEIWVPLEVNFNHLGTAFGGSLGTALILSGYAWLFHRLSSEGIDVHVVLKSGHTRYLKPVEQDFTACTRAPAADAYETFIKAVRSKGRAQIELHSEISSGEEVACSYEGIFVAKVSKG